MNPEVRSGARPERRPPRRDQPGQLPARDRRSPEGDPQGVAPDMAAEIAKRLGVGIAWVPFATPSELADAAADDAWDVGLIGAEPARAETISFTAAYTEIEATYLVPADSALRGVEDVDREGVRIAVARGSAYDLFLSRRLEHAELVRASGLDGSFDLFVEQKLDALAGAPAAPHLRRGAAARRAHPRREVHGRAAGGGDAAPARTRGGVPSRVRRGKRRRAGSCSASSTATASADYRSRAPRSGPAVDASQSAPAGPARHDAPSEGRQGPAGPPPRRR